MNMHPPEDRLQDYLDELLCREERAEVEAHLAHCEACRLHVVHERELQRRLAALPRDLQPERDLLPEIHARIGSGARVQRMTVGATLWRVRYPLAAAALVLVALTATLTTMLSRRGDVAPATAAAPHFAGTRSYEIAASELEALLREQVVPAAARPQLDASLRALDAALAETGQALQRDPDNTSLVRLIGALQQQKLELLRSATRPRRTS